MAKISVLSSILLILNIVNNVYSARILGVFPTPSISHQIVFQPIWRELSLRGHEVTVITPDPLKDPNLTNLTEIDVHDVSYGAWKKFKIGSLGTTDSNKDLGLDSFVQLYKMLFKVQMSDPEVQELIADKSRYFDLVMVEYLWPSFMGFHSLYNSQLIGVVSLPPILAAYDALGSPSHPVTHPDIILPFNSDLTLVERLKSVLYSIVSRAYSTFVLQESINKEMWNYFPNCTKTTRQLAKDMSLLFANINPVLTKARPLVPNLIPFSGLHIKPPKPLPSDLQKYLDSSKRGVIYLSFGSNIQSSQLPVDKMKIILSVFEELPHDILWKFETDNLPAAKPKNVLINKWLPQQDILRHRNVKLFISQGGLQSLEEATYAGVPILTIPFFGDQHRNARCVEDSGNGLRLSFQNLTKDSFREFVDKALRREYKQRAQQLSEVIKDKPTSDLDKIIWWTEFVLRHEGAPHLRSPTADLPLYQYFLLDVVAIFLSAAAVVAIVTTMIVKLLLRSLKFIFVSKMKAD